MPNDNVAVLLEQSVGVMKKYDEQYRETGEKYNIFQIAHISENELNYVQRYCRFAQSFEQTL
ncbi:MAG: hypothetical protein Pg6A_12110 [Termitinemataceae bacterium]|nr:MAG: hypothetical protein Pg6A_12110 [Termitinemataceae bacterium]